MRYKKDVFRSLAMVSQLGLSVLTPILLCVWTGYEIDRRFHKETMLVFLLIGIASGAKSGWDMVGRVLKADRQETEKRRREELSGVKPPSAIKPKRPSRIKDYGESPLSEQRLNEGEEDSDG